MKTPWLYGLALIVVLNIVVSLFIGRPIRMFRMPLMLAAYVVCIVLCFKLGVWPALALWWGIGLVIGWSYEFRSARHSKDADVKPPSLGTVVHHLFTWPIIIPLKLFVALGWVVVNGPCSLVYSLYKKLVPNRVPHYAGIEGCKKAAVSGDARAQFTLGCCYESGEFGLPQDYAESAKWYRKAAEQNHGTAQLNLGVCLGEGKGVEKNVVEGLMWISLSVHVFAQHSAGWLFRDAAYQAQSRLKAQMTEQEIAEAWVMLDSSALYKDLY